MKTSIAKNQLIFLEKCFKSNILPKSLCLKQPVNSTKGYIIMKDFWKKLITLAKKNVKQKMYCSSKKLQEVSLHLNKFPSDEHYIFI